MQSVLSLITLSSVYDSLDSIAVIYLRLCVFKYIDKTLLSNSVSVYISILLIFHIFFSCIGQISENGHDKNGKERKHITANEKVKKKLITCN